MNANTANKALLDEFLYIIENSEFKRIFKKFGFKQIYKSHEVNDGRHDRYTIGYESSTCRLGFFYEFGGGVGVQLGPIPADTTSWETMTWIGIDYIEAYLLNKPIAKGHRKTFFSRTKNIEIDISAAATSFVLIGTQAIAMFKDDETIALWKPKLEEYIKEDTRRRYGLK